MAFTKTAGVEYGTPEVVLSTTAASGSNQTAIRTDGQLIAFDVSVPTSVVSSDSASAGSVALAARRDHTHGAPVILGAATEEQMVAESASTVSPTAATTKFAPGVAKAWAYVDTDGSNLGSYNVSGTARNSTGNFTVTLDDDIGSAAYSVVSNAAGGSGADEGSSIHSIAAGSFGINVIAGAASADRATCSVVFGTM
tara:strand:- start:189 stop:779 length:591 start_codon:yes stop_codon:yes gene_type:complete